MGEHTVLKVVTTATLATYSDAACTRSCSKFAHGSRIYVNGDITTTDATTNTTVKIEYMSINGVMDYIEDEYGDMVTNGAGFITMLDDTHNFTANTVTSIKTDINSGTAPSVLLNATHNNQYLNTYIRLSISGEGVETTYIYIRVEILKIAITDTYFALDGTDASGGDPQACFEVGDTVYLYGYWTPALHCVSDISSEIYDSSFVLVDTLNLWEDYALSDSVSYTLSDLADVVTSWDSTGSDPGIYHWLFKITNTVTNVNLPIYLYFELKAPAPVISNAAIDDSTITTSGSARITFKASNMSGAPEELVGAYINGKFYVSTTTDNETYSITVDGVNTGVLTGETIYLIASSSAGSDSDSSLSLTVTDANTEAVLLLHSLLDANWNSGNVAKPTLVIGGTSGHDDTRGGDIVKIYRSATPTVRQPRGRRNYETLTDYVEISVHTSTSTPRARLEELKEEITRIINAASITPGGGFTRMWLETSATRKESSKHFWATLTISLDRIYSAVVS
jgi:hypothetical protein